MPRLSARIPIPPEVSVFAVKQRLDWGEPALTIIDVRNREIFNQKRITGAISMPLESLVRRASESLVQTRDIYLYGGTDAESAAAAAQLKQAGFQRVAELRGGLEAWQAAGYPIERVPFHNLSQN